MGLRSVSLKTAERLASALDLDGLILVAFKDGVYKAVSWGDTREHCGRLRPILDQIADEVKA